jgi:SAM-dependent methyltransferase
MIKARFVQFVYIVFFALLSPLYYANRIDFKRNTRKNPFYVSRLVRFIERNPIFYEIAMLVQNFPVPKNVYKLLPEVKGDVLQVGCGTGLLNKYWKDRKDIRLVNLDTNLHSLQCGLKWGRYASFIHSGIYDVPLESQSFDTIIFARCFHHIKYHKKAFAECARLLRKDGTIIITDPVVLHDKTGNPSSEGYMANSSIDGVIWRFTKESLKKRIDKTLPPELKLVSLTDHRQVHITNFNLKVPQTDALLIIQKL